MQRLVQKRFGINEGVLCPSIPACLSAGSELRLRGLNRIGNMLVPNDNYCKFEDWIMPVLNQMLKEQQELGTNWTPSKVGPIQRDPKAGHSLLSSNRTDWKSGLYPFWSPQACLECNLKHCTATLGLLLWFLAHCAPADALTCECMRAHFRSHTYATHPHSCVHRHIFFHPQTHVHT